MSTRARIIPTDTLLSWRAAFLERLLTLEPIKPESPKGIELSPGNSKTGQTGRHYTSMFVWNLPSVVTCPGATNWCLRHCYNADDRGEKFPVLDWTENWWASINDGDSLFRAISSQLSRAEKPCAVRIHSSGDFFSERYIDLWHRIISANPDVRFWAYTRSWACSNMTNSLARLRRLANVQLFASVDDATTVSPPQEWRRSYVVYSEEDAATLVNTVKGSVICPEQLGNVANCASCGICIDSLSTNIVFLFH